MGYTAVIKDGKVVDTSASNLSDSMKNRKAGGTLDKEAFLQLLVAQMQYQDPLEPMSNTEYVAQLATFSELEAMNNLNDSMSIARASGLVGKNVIVKTTSEKTGETYMTQGRVDYIVVENGNSYLAIGEGLYSLDDLDTVLSDEYWEEYQKNQANGVKPPNEDSDADPVKAKDVITKINDLPDVAKVTKDDEKAIKEARAAYNALSEDEKKLISNDVLYKLIQAEGALAKLNAQDSEDSAGGDTGSDADASGE